MKNYIILLFMLIAYSQVFAQKEIVVKDVQVPDEVRIEEFRSYGTEYEEQIQKKETIA